MGNRFAHKLTIATLLGALILSACGIKGDLKTPPPLWGDKTQADKQSSEKQKHESNN